MKLKHWIGVGFAVVGGLFLLHVVMHHGGFQGIRSGIGLGS